MNKVLVKFFGFYYQSFIPQKTFTHWITPKPRYLSQFVGIYPQTISPDVPLTNKQHIKAFGAKDAKEFTFWAWRDCGIACVKMILDTLHKAKGKTMMDLTKEGIVLGGYIVYRDGKFVDEGWFHAALVELLTRYGVKAKMKRWQSLTAVARDILGNKFVILSVLIPGRRSIQSNGSFLPKENATYGGHLLLATGVQLEHGNVVGVYVHDPRGLPAYQKNTFIPKKTLERIFTNRTIVAYR